MADISKVVLPNQSNYDLKDKNAARSGGFEPDSNEHRDFYFKLKNAAGTTIDTKKFYLWFDDTNNLFQIWEVEQGGNRPICEIGLPWATKYFEFEPNQATPTEFWIKCKSENGTELDNHWLLFTMDNNDLVLKDWNHSGTEVFRIPFLATYIDFESENGAPNNFYMNLKDNQGTIISSTHCFINNRGGTFVFGYEDRNGVWHDIASC